MDDIESTPNKEQGISAFTGIEDKRTRIVKDVSIHVDNSSGHSVPTGILVDGAFLPCKRITINFENDGNGFVLLKIPIENVRIEEDIDLENGDERFD